MTQMMQETLLNSLLSPEQIRLQDNPEARKQLSTWANSTYTTLKSNRARVERLWYINLAFFRGRQNIAFINTPTVASGFRLLTPPAPPWRVRMVINKIRGIIRRERAKLTAQKPSFVVVPATNEDEDYYAARAATQILDAIYDDYEISEVNASRQWWGSICGTSFIKCYWDNNKIAKQKGPADPYTGQPTEVRGDFCIENLVPFFLFVPDLMEEDINNQPFVFHVYVKGKAWVERYYGTQLVTKMTTKTREGDILEEAFFDVAGLRKPLEEQYRCMEIWIKPGGHKLFPKGGVLTIVGDQIVQITEEFPYSHGDYPFIRYCHIQSGQFYGHSVIDDLIPLQREYNRTRSQIIEAKNLMAKPKLMGPRGAVDPTKITSEPGQYIPYEPGLGEVKPLPMQNLPPFVGEEVVRIRADMDDISGQHEISRGNTPPQVTAATAISYLQEQDDSMISEIISAIEAGHKKLGYHLLTFVADYWSQDRLVKVAGKDESFDAMLFKGSKLRGNTDVRVEAGSALPHSKAARQAFLMDLFKMGVFQQNPSEFLRILDLRGIDKVLADYKIDIAQAQRENIKMSQGIKCEIHDFDNHEIHLEQHNRFSRTQEYEMLDDPIKALFLAHRQAHQQAIFLNQSEAMRLQGMMGQQVPGVPQQIPGQQLPQGGGMNGQRP